MYSLKHEQQCFIGFKIKLVLQVFWTASKTWPFYEFIGEVILKINLIWNLSEIYKEQERVLITYTHTH